MEMEIGKGWLWLALGICLFFVTFGGLAVFLSLYLIAFLCGFLAIVFHCGKNSLIFQESQKEQRKIDISKGVKKVLDSMEPTTRIKNFDKRMTGASVIDDKLKEVLEFTVRDYIKTWYRQISDHDNFLQDIWQCAQKIIISFSYRSKSIDWMPYFTQRLVDDFASHIRLYRRAADKTALSKQEDNGAALESSFFDMEVTMEQSLCRDRICLDPKAERQYLQDLSDVLLYLLLPTEDFHNKPFRYIIREVLVNAVFLPTINLLSDPDYINQYMAWMCLETSFSTETFLTVIRASDNEAELEAVRDKVDSDIAKWRSKDTGGSDDTSVKQNLNSLMFVRETCDMRINRLKDGTDNEPILEEPDFMKYQNLYALSLDDIFNNNVALQSFIEYLKTRGGEQYLFFYLNVEGFRTAAEQQITEKQKQFQDSKTSVEPDLESLRKLALIIYDQYLSDKASVKLKIDPHIMKYTNQRVKSKMIAEDVFDSVQARVYQILHVQYYEDFLQCPAYVKLLGDIGLLDGGDNISLDEDGSCQAGGSECSLGSQEDLVDTKSEDTVSLTSASSGSSAASVASTPVGDLYLFAQITQTGIVKENDGKSYAVFAVHVRKKEQYAEEEEIWEVFRRYSDFHDLHMILTEKFPDLKPPHLPGKTMLKKTSTSFLEKRRKDLDKYLRGVMQPDLLHHVPGLEDLLNKFLRNGVWEKHKSEFSRKMDTFVNPIKTASKSVGNVVKSVPDGVVKIGDGIGKAFSSQKTTREQKNEKVGAGLERFDGDRVLENIPLRIMLLLMDEVFDLRHKNQWLRRRIAAIIRQLIKATFGDKINRKIVEHVDFMTSAEQVAEYIAKFRNSFWPNGVLAEPQNPRDDATKMRTRVLCKAKMLGSVPDEVKTLMGTDSVRKGVARIFEMFQHKNLNKRFVYVVLEGVIANLFPDNKFQALFRNLHSCSKRAEKLEEEQKTLNTHQDGLRQRTGRR